MKIPNRPKFRWKFWITWNFYESHRSLKSLESRKLSSNLLFFDENGSFTDFWTKIPISTTAFDTDHFKLSLSIEFSDYFFIFNTVFPNTSVKLRRNSSIFDRFCSIFDRFDWIFHQFSSIFLHFNSYCSVSDAFLNYQSPFFSLKIRFLQFQSVSLLSSELKIQMSIAQFSKSFKTNAQCLQIPQCHC